MTRTVVQYEYTEQGKTRLRTRSFGPPVRVPRVGPAEIGSPHLGWGARLERSTFDRLAKFWGRPVLKSLVKIKKFELVFSRVGSRDSTIGLSRVVHATISVYGAACLYLLWRGGTL